MRSFKTTDERYKSSKRVSNNIFQVLIVAHECLMKYSKQATITTQHSFLKTVLNDRKEFLKVQVFPFLLEGGLFGMIIQMAVKVNVYHVLHASIYYRR